MKCPLCTETDLVLAERQGVEIDYCPKCRGVWLDRGELDKILERSLAVLPASAGTPFPSATSAHEPVPADYQHPDRHDDHRKGQAYGSYGNHHQRKRSWLTELFD